MNELDVVVPTGFEPVFEHDLDFALFNARLEDLLEMKDSATKTSNPLKGEHQYPGGQDDFK